MKRIGQFLAAFRSRQAIANLSADVFYLEGAEPADRRAPRALAKQTQPVATYSALDDDAAYHLAATAFDPCAMTEDENRRLANLLLDAEAIDMHDYKILLRGPARRCGTLADIRAPRNYLADWQDNLSRHMSRDDHTAVGADSRALTILGKIMVVRNEAA